MPKKKGKKLLRKKAATKKQTGKRPTQSTTSKSAASKKASSPTSPKSSAKNFKIKSLSSLKHRTLTSLLDDIEKNPDKINRLKKKNEWFGFKVFGNRSTQVFSDISLLAEQLQAYSSVRSPHEAFKNLSSKNFNKNKSANELVNNIVVVKAPTSKKWQAEKKLENKRRQEKKEKDARKIKRLEKQVKSLKGKLTKKKGSTKKKGKKK